ncbi:MAG: oligosaccharide flippase family protein, partial [Bdellovibrionales bacterium]|nr:oligosaccharide flippase family protein [Bdellovibrionales bacterium]
MGSTDNQKSAPFGSYQDLKAGSSKSRLSFLLRDSILYGSLDVASRMLGIFIVPIIVRVFSVAQYAIVDGLSVAKALLTSVMLLGLNQATARFISQYEEEKDRKEIAGEGMFVALTVAIVGVLVLYPFAVPICSAIFGEVSASAVAAFRIMLCILP